MRFAIFFLSILITAHSAKAAEFVIECEAYYDGPPLILKYEEGLFSDDVYVFAKGKWIAFCEDYQTKFGIRKSIKTVKDKRVECLSFDEDNVRSSKSIIDFSAKVYRSTYTYELDMWRKDRNCKSR